ncbi:PilZ domain-containing protein [Pseudomonas fluorescens]|uniref:PilZ domain-containing protein n=1 Tax=Pseudomonas lactucae TaxID=2813360 RepID=A0A9X1C2G3_9PSED|nr:PilZ domain-containing protein [Pseudomonas lactucae]OPA95498.1 PilZ domain-containing protein [Pseudomonas fluorescens]MBN2974961.1 PilZ domain-containing protein [Pseudomonas lactucae]MBN2986069.1 PilZ domain-containing protein [Pseudomonas lactucae]OPB12823.1 PilZ domain-containing protein [Pseudomonas fluorescens]OPB25223.1 PilZ domain-containing protein [Pseudomonas fluorescens]
MSQHERDYAEKRDFIRMKVDADVSLIHAGQEIAGVCLDLSSSGMQVQAPRQFTVGDLLTVRIESEHAALAGLEADTEVVWAKTAGDEQQLGLKILKMR